MSLIFLLVGLSLVVGGFLMWRLQLVDIIAGYDERKTKDKAGLARWAGMNLILMGIAVSLLSAGYHLMAGGIHPLLFLGTVMVVILLVAVRTVLGTRKFEK